MEGEHLVYLEGRPRIILTEWIPTGAHFVHMLQTKLGYAINSPVCCPSEPDSVQTCLDSKFYITGEVDSEPNAAIVDIGESEVRVRVLEYQHMEYIRLECCINI
jgi:hypothetical protein